MGSYYSEIRRLASQTALKSSVEFDIMPFPSTSLKVRQNFPGLLNDEQPFFNLQHVMSEIRIDGSGSKPPVLDLLFDTKQERRTSVTARFPSS